MKKNKTRMVEEPKEAHLAESIPYPSRQGREEVKTMAILVHRT